MVFAVNVCQINMQNSPSISHLMCRLMCQLMRHLMKISLSKISSLFILLIAIISTNISAHPHSWVDLQTEFIVNEKGHLAVIKQRWTLDVFYSAIRLASVKKDPEGQEKGLEKLAKTMANSLGNFNYFSELKIGEASLSLPMPDQYSLAIKSENQQEQLVLSMEFALNHSQTLIEKSLSFFYQCLRMI